MTRGEALVNVSREIFFLSSFRFADLFFTGHVIGPPSMMEEEDCRRMECKADESGATAHSHASPWSEQHAQVDEGRILMQRLQDTQLVQNNPGHLIR